MRTRARAPIVLAIIVAIYSLLPFVFGIFAQRYASEFLEQENRTLGSVIGLHLSFERYERGWFSSTAILKIEEKNVDGQDEVVKTIPLTIFHGPLYQITSNPRMGLALMSANNITFDALPKYRLLFQNNISFNGDRALLALAPSNGVDVPSVMDADFLQLSMNSNFDADHFFFRLEGAGLRYQSPDHTLSAAIKTIQSTLRVDYLSERHWQLQWGLLSNQDKVSLALQNGGPELVFGADQINVNGMHFDTEKMAKLLSQIAQIKSADDAGQAVPPSAWIGVAQEFLTQIIGNDTRVRLHNLSVTSPAGQILLHYNASFPSLPDVHDYFDISTQDVSQLALSIPDWTYSDAQSQTAFGVSKFKLTSENNTVFSRQVGLDLGLFDIKSMKPDEAQTPVLYAAGLSYQGHNYGDAKTFSQVMQWRLNRLCFSQDCFDHVKGELNLLNMNFAAFRGIATAMQAMVQYDPAQSESTEMKWSDLEKAYASLVTPQTRVVLSHDMQTPAGDVKFYAALSWPDFVTPPSVMPNIDLFLEKSQYMVRAQLPVAYVDAFLTHQPSEPKAAIQKPTEKPEEKAVSVAQPDMEVQAAQLIRYAVSAGYLKKVGDAYVLDLTGKGSDATVNGIPWQTPDADSSASTAAPSAATVPVAPAQ